MPHHAAGAAPAPPPAGDGWTLVELRDGRLASYGVHDDLPQVLDAAADADALALAAPVGHDDPTGEVRRGRRACDLAARGLLGPRRGGLALVPPPDLLREPTLEAAQEAADDRGWVAPTAELWRTRERVLEVEEALMGDEFRDRVVEAHPEVSLQVLQRSLGGASHLDHPRRTRDGLEERIGLLHEVELRPRRVLGGVGRASPRDVLDATAAAWTAHRHAAGRALRVPDEGGDPRDPRTGRVVVLRA